MPAKINLLNQTFGQLTVIEETEKRKNKSVVWKCKCSCGNEQEFSTKELRNDGIIMCQSCGNKRDPKTNLTENIIGKTFNHLTVINKTDKRQSGKILYECECDCEKHTHIYVSRTDLLSNHTTSCGCKKFKFNIGDIINNRKILSRNNKNNERNYYICQCLLCGREYEALSQTLQKTISCGCQRSIGEFNIIQILNKHSIKYKKEYCFPNSLFRFDFAILNENNEIIYLIEFDGEQHYENNIKNSGWSTYEKYEYTHQNDIEKNNLAKNLNIPLVRIPYWERDNISYELLFSDKYLIK